MDISQDMLIDLALNVLSFLVAGMLSVVIYSMFQKDRKKDKKASMNETFEKITLPRREGEIIDDRSPAEFIQFKGIDNKNTRNINSRDRVTRFNNRDKVLQSALEMIKQGVSESEIKAALPISSAELAVLGLNKENNRR
ncbi:MAG: hypothetical protein ABIJ12_08495 [bacterium]